MYHLSEYNMLPGTIISLHMTYKFQYNSSSLQRTKSTYHYTLSLLSVLFESSFASFLLSFYPIQKLFKLSFRINVQVTKDESLQKPWFAILKLRQSV
jgi:hypothetical protein